MQNAQFCIKPLDLLCKFHIVLTKHYFIMQNQRFSNKSVCLQCKLHILKINPIYMNTEKDFFEPKQIFLNPETYFFGP